MEQEIIEALDNVGPITTMTALENEYYRQTRGYRAVLLDRAENTTWQHIPTLTRELDQRHHDIQALSDALTAINPEWDKAPF